MKKLEDAPKELQDFLKLELAKWPMPPDRQTEHAFRLAVEHFFLKGFDVAMATGGMKKSFVKRTFDQVIVNDKYVFAMSNDGLLFRRRIDYDGNEWRQQPDLPQD